MPTSILVSLLFWGITSKKRSVADRTKTLEAFKSIVSKAMSVKGRLDVTITKPGYETEHSFQLDSSLLLPGALVWPLSHDDRQAAKDAWETLRTSRAHSFVNSHFDQPHVFDLIFFAMDSNHLPGKAYQETAFSLTTFLAGLLDNVLEFYGEVKRKNDASFRSCVDRKAQYRIKQCAAAMILWHGPDGYEAGNFRAVRSLRYVA